jgi:ubiquinone/menaquinone biosynthesis C-methylase UbiE
MPTTAANKHHWDSGYDWRQGGDEWSQPWGSVAGQWYGTILPRINTMLPTATVLEIACGYGRWTRYLKDSCQHLIVVDLAPKCVTACKDRFAHASNIEYHTNDGMSLAMIPDRSVDFVFSFDSLVHADHAVMSAYLGEIQRLLRDDGSAFLHHSNLGELRSAYHLLSRCRLLRRLLMRLNMLRDLRHSRDLSVSAHLVEQLAKQHGLQCVVQELVRWRDSTTAIDCLSTIVKCDSPRARSNHVVRNLRFMQEAEIARRRSEIYESSTQLGAPERVPR